MKKEKGHKSLRNKAIKTFKILNVGWNALPVIVFCIILCLYVGGVFSNLINDEESRSVITFHTTQIQLIVNLLLIPLSLYVLIKVLKGKNPFNIYLLCVYVTLAVIIGIIWYKGEWKWNSFFYWEYILLVVLFASLVVYESYKIKLVRTYFNASKNSQDDEAGNLGFCVRTKDKNFIDVGWGNYTKALKSRMSHTQLDNGESFAIGISGQWGSGKTTFLDTLEKELGNDFIVIRFIPWYSCTPTTLVKDFFDCVSSELGSMHIDIDFSKYIELLQEIDSIGALKIINQLIPYNDNDSIENVKRDIEEKLSLIEKKVVIIIDDTDRLRSDELMEMLKIIRLTANFNNVVFVVSYDKAYILEKIKEAGIDNNSEYLKKIFPLEIVLPLVEDIVMSDMFVGELEKSNLNESFLSNIKQQLAEEQSAFLFQKYIKNFRDVKNFTNTLIVCNDLLKQTNFENEISYRDIFWIEVIRTYFPELYHILCHERNNILEPIEKHVDGGVLPYKALPAIIEEQDKKDEKIKLKISLKEKYGDGIETILQLLFNDDNKDETSIRLLDNYYKYFAYRLPKNVISIDEFSTLLLKKNEVEIRNKISDYNNENKIPSLYRRLAYFKLNACTNEGLEINNFLIALFEMVDYYCEINYLIVLFQNNLDAANSEFIKSDFVCNLFKEKLEDKKCKHDKWNKVLVSIYPQISSKNQDIENHSILSDKEIEDLAITNCTNYLNTFHPSISEITNEKSDLHKLIKDACVLCSFGTNRSLKRKCLIYDSLLKHYSLRPEKNNKNEFMKPFDIGIFEATSEEVQKRVYERQENLFGSIEKFHEFVEKCFISE